jgi:hypothetical protein
MKQIRLMSRSLIACGIAFAMVTALTAQGAAEGLAKVVGIHGSARYMASANGTWQPLKNGTVLKPGAIIQTASRSSVDLVLNNPDAGPVFASGKAAGPPAAGMAYQPKVEQDAVRLFENTVLAIDKLTVDQTGVDVVTETQLDLKAGRLFGTVKKLAAASKYEVKIPNGVAGIRGTIYYLTAEGILRVLSGSVVVAYVGADGAVVTQVVSAGQEFDTRTGSLTGLVQSSLDELNALAQTYRARGGTVTYVTPEVFIYVSPTEAMTGGGSVIE